MYRDMYRQMATLMRKQAIIMPLMRRGLIAGEALQVVAQLDFCPCELYADALLLLSGRGFLVKGLLSILKRPEEYIAVPVHEKHLPKELYSDVVYLRPLSAAAESIHAPYGADTVYQVKPRIARGRTGAYKLPAP